PRHRCARRCGQGAHRPDVYPRHPPRRGDHRELPRQDRRIPAAGGARLQRAVRRRVLRRRAAGRRSRGRRGVIVCACAVDAEPMVASERRAAAAMADLWRPALAALAARLGAEARIAVARRAAELHALPGAVIVADVVGDAAALAAAAAGADRVVRITDMCPDPIVTIAGDVAAPGVRIVPDGATVEDVVEAHGPRPIAWVALAGGPLTGRAVDRDARIGRHTRR